MRRPRAVRGWRPPLEVALALAVAVAGLSLPVLVLLGFPSGSIRFSIGLSLLFMLSGLVSLVRGATHLLGVSGKGMRDSEHDRYARTTGLVMIVAGLATIFLVGLLVLTIVAFVAGMD